MVNPRNAKSAGEDTRRVTLRLAVKLMIWLGIAMAAWVLLTPFGDSPRQKKLTGAAVFDVSDLQAGEVRFMEWQGKPLIVAYRTTELETILANVADSKYRDPYSESSWQPEFAKNALRSSTPNWFVAIGLGTGLGCALTYQPPSDREFNGGEWPGGFVDACDASRYDLSGRVFAGQSAAKNIAIPHWQLQQQKIVLKAQ